VKTAGTGRPPPGGHSLRAAQAPRWCGPVNEGRPRSRSTVVCSGAASHKPGGQSRRTPSARSRPAPVQAAWPRLPPRRPSATLFSCSPALITWPDPTDGSGRIRCPTCSRISMRLICPVTNCDHAGSLGGRRSSVMPFEVSGGADYSPPDAFAHGIAGSDSRRAEVTSPARTARRPRARLGLRRVTPLHLPRDEAREPQRRLEIDALVDATGPSRLTPATKEQRPVSSALLQ